PIAQIAMADEARAVPKGATKPVAPDGPGWRHEARAEPGELRQHPAEREMGFVRPGAGMRRGAGQIGEGFAALLVEASADDARGAAEPFRFKEAQKGVDGGRPGAGVAVDDIADAPHGGTAAAG